MAADPIFFLPASLVLDVPELDSQHRALFAQLAEIKAACLDENHLPASLGEELLNALQDHFATEERLAEEAGIEFSAHCRNHDQMLGAIARAIAQVVDGSKDVFGILRFIEYWFERHIGDDDRRLAQRLHSMPRRSGRDVAPAIAAVPTRERYHQASGMRL